MGSGHFMVTAVDFLSDTIASLIERVPAVPEWLDDYASPLVQRVERIRRDIRERAREADWVIDEAQLTDQAIIRRMLLKRCIYGVDKNPLTVELAKVSLWLHSFTVGAPPGDSATPGHRRPAGRCARPSQGEGGQPESTGAHLRRLPAARQRRTQGVAGEIRDDVS